jgi:hypothetical protein
MELIEYYKYRHNQVYQRDIPNKTIYLLLNGEWVKYAGSIFFDGVSMELLHAVRLNKDELFLELI